MTAMTKIGMVSLGCDKNRVDSEKMLFALKTAGYGLTDNPSDADVIIINTCAFIDSAKKESIDAILEYSALKKDRPVKIVVAGCLAERYAEEIRGSFPEADVFAGINSYGDIVGIVESGEGIIKPEGNICLGAGRVLTTPAHYAYLKIADGCDNFCSYCAIPFIRGRYRSYPMENLVAEAETLAASGVKELILVAQDVTRYGKDLYGRYAVKDLLAELTKLGFFKIRIMYAYPELIDDALIDLVANDERIAKYLDVPMQHVATSVLKRMRRRTDGDAVRALAQKIRSAGITLRSTFIAGFPAETEEEFAQLRDFIGEGNVDYAGFFAYSKEEGTAAAKITPQIPARIKNLRQKELSKLQSRVIVDNHARFLGETVKVIYEGLDYDKLKFYGRTERNAPEIDTKVFFTSDFSLEIGNYYDVKITGTGFNLIGKTV